MTYPRPVRRAALALGLAVLSLAGRAPAQTTPPDAFDGSFHLSSGEIVTGGYFVEGGDGLFLYMDLEGLDRGGLFARVDEMRFRSLVPDDTVELEFARAADGSVGRLTWRETGREPVTGERVYPHASTPVTILAGDGTVLAGRLLTPACAAPHPLVVSVHGSGPVNRFGGPYHTFFLRHGVAVLAYDKRGSADDVDVWEEPDLATLSADAAAAMRFAAARPEVDANRLGFMGSSQAGWVVPRAAVEAPDTDFLIMRAAAALPVLETVLHEVRQELRADGLTGLDLDDAMYLRRELYELAVSGAPLAAADTLATPYRDRDWYRTAFGDGPPSERWPQRSWTWQ